MKFLPFPSPSSKLSQNRIGLSFILLFCLLTLLVLTRPVSAAPGVDGDLTITTLNTVINRYSAVTAIAGNVVTVNNINDLDDGGAGHYTNNDLSPGDLIMIYQAQGASFADTTDSATYGAFNYLNAGNYELAVVESVAANSITVDSSSTTPYSCGGIVGSYTIAGNVQVVRVPQYSNLTIDPGASVTGNAWNGSTGGIVALNAQYVMTINGDVDATGIGFRGGIVDNSSTNPPANNLGYRSTNSADGGEKGESILGFQTDYDGVGRYGRGAPANGGGGGNSHNAGGGGGANGNNGGTWNGSGFVSAADPLAQAWDLDDGTNDAGAVPGYFQGGAGGGRGGYSYSANDQNALTLAPGNGGWGGDNRFQNGGLGGRPLDNNPASRLFFGGGGGAGDANNNAAQDGGDGGGLVLLIAETATGTGQILANGNAGPDTVGGHNDAPGGGGGGGTVVLRADALTGSLSISANGGVGGDQLIVSNEGEGPGGGGGGGFVAVASDSGSLTASVDGSVGGTTTSLSLTEFTPNGATESYSGNSSLVFNDSSVITFPGCLVPTAITLANLQTGQNNSLPLTLAVIVLLMGLSVFYYRLNKEK